MLLLFHIFIAVVSLVFSSYMYLHPVKSKLRITYISVAFTILSGILLLINYPNAVMQTCFSGALYLGTVLVYTTAAKNKLSQNTRVYGLK
jgi:hypothetical protein